MPDEIHETPAIEQTQAEPVTTGQKRVIGQRLLNGFRATTAAGRSGVAYTGAYLSNRFPASSNFVGKTTKAVAQAAYGTAHFYDLATVVKCSVGCAHSLYSAVFETAALALGKRKSEFAPKAALATAGATTALAAAYVIGAASVEEKDPSLLYANECGDTGTYTVSEEPAADRYFDKAAVLDFTSDGGVSKRVALWTRDIPYNPDVVTAYQESPRIRQYVDLAVSEAEIRGINPAMFVNLLHRESMGFNPDVVSGERKSPAGAIGIAQFMPNTAEQYYDLSEEDLGDWQKAIPASAEHIAMLQARNNNDPVLALFEYNGGLSSVEYAKTETGNENLTGGDVMRFYQDRRDMRNQCGYIAAAWHNETFKYVGIITGQSWQPDHFLAAKYADVSYEDFAIDPQITARELNGEQPEADESPKIRRPEARPDNFAEIVAEARQKAAVEAALRNVMQ